MKATMAVRIVLVLSTLIFVSGADSQPYSPGGFQQGFELHGTIVHRPGTLAGNLMVEVCGLNGRLAKTTVSPDGTFDFSSIPAGQYDVRVLDLAGNVVTEQEVWVHDSFADVQIRLPEGKTEPPVSGTVSLAQLMHKVPSKARKETLLAQKAWKKGDLPACADHLQRATGIDPEYLDAWNSLALVYVRLNQPEKVISTYSEVLRIDPHSALAYSLTGAAHMTLGHYPEAEVASRRALRIDSNSERSRYVLGLSLAQQNKNDSEALKYLQESYDAFPMARMVAAQVLARRGHIGEARSQLEKYLPLAPPSQGDQLKRWLATLK